MKIKEDFRKNLENGIITEEMLELVLYSLNKRAKNCRDQKRAYRYAPKYREVYEEKEAEYYAYKDFLLRKLLQPVCIHYVYHAGRAWWNESLGDYVYDDAIEYFLFYRTTNYSFHLPIDPDEVENKYKHLPVIEVDRLETTGKPIKELLSVQFCKKLVKLVESGNYRFIKKVGLFNEKELEEREKGGEQKCKDITDALFAGNTTQLG